MFELWDPVKTARKRANQNLSYRADEYAPAPPPFVTDPLRFDLEPNNFLRIEGHLGKNVQSVLETLLSLKKSHRLPIEVIALRTGAFDENIEVDLSKEECRFQDLETLYEALKSELICFLVKQVQYFYALPPTRSSLGEEAAVPTLWLLKTYAPDFVAQPGTLGTQDRGSPDLEAGTDRSRFIFAARRHAQPAEPGARPGRSDVGPRRSGHRRHPRRSTSPPSATATGPSSRSPARSTSSAGAARTTSPGLSDRLDDIVFRCRLDPFEALAEEYKRRVREVKQAQFLSHFLEQHPGIQHKAGVPLGGTFILVYHELPETGARPRRRRPRRAGPLVGARRRPRRRPRRRRSSSTSARPSS